MMRQKDAVYQAVSSIVGIEPGTPVSLDRDQKATVTSILVEGFKSGKITYDGEVPEDKELRSYTSGLLNNWLRKDKRLNGGVAYVPKNPGSRAGSSDPQIKAMRLLLSTKTDPKDRAEIQAFIDKRQQELHKVEVEVNAEDLPEELHKFLA
ncbi:MAG: hypothetical protein EBZ48_18135 [Proteobacteria bacterium]|nr:hypothetical protein [Pseudomonadota bacterium]